MNSWRYRETAVTIRLPRVAVSRELADSLVKEAEVRTRDEVIVDGRGLVVHNVSFAFELAGTLSSNNPRSVMILGGRPNWHDDISKAADYFGLHIVVETLTIP